MNVTELARQLKIPTTALKDLIPKLGFDVGRKAIKIDARVAEQIMEKIKAQPGLLEQIRRGKPISVETTEDHLETSSTEKRMLVLPQKIAVRDFADQLGMPVTDVIKQLMNNGILASLNEHIDFETASIIAEDLGYNATLNETASTLEETTVESILENEKQGSLSARPPVIVVMGHVDHGKTKLLDAIRKTDVVAQEAGSITQHIGAYQVVYKNTPITFIDTPGHEAFTTMRSRGARVADIAILVVAADEGIKPQTEEAITIIQNSKLPFVVAINKIDKENADIERVKQQLAAKDLLTEDWGGKIITAPISAKQGMGIDQLLDTILLVAELEREEIVANRHGRAVGTIIESHIDKGEGPVATVLVQSGTLRTGNLVSIGTISGKIKNMRDYRGAEVTEAGPSMPVKILGLKSSSSVGDILQVHPDLKALKGHMKGYEEQKRIYEASLTNSLEKEDGIEKLAVILKTDTLGSQEAILQSLERLSLPDFKIAIAKKALGNVADSDIEAAEATGAIIYGFNVKTNLSVEQSAKERGVKVKLYNIIYELTDDVQQEAEKILSPEIVRTEEGRIKVLAIFRTEKNSMIIGGTVTKGRALEGAQTRVLRNQQPVGHGKLVSLQAGKQSVREVVAVNDCGMQFSGKAVVKVGDILEMYTEEKRYRKLSAR
ncbi:MAG: translation initiation factor IF-2 [Parcubacteria group bacterium]